MLEMYSQGRECVKFVKEKNGLLEPNPVFAVGNIEVWLQALVDGRGLHSSTFQLNLSRF